MNNENQISSGGINQASVNRSGDRVLKLGLDLHYRQVTVAMQEDGGRIRAAGKMSHEGFLNWVQKKLEKGWQIYSCYEAGGIAFVNNVLNVVSRSSYRDSKHEHADSKIRIHVIIPRHAWKAGRWPRSARHFSASRNSEGNLRL